MTKTFVAYWYTYWWHGWVINVIDDLLNAIIDYILIAHEYYSLNSDIFLILNMYMCILWFSGILLHYKWFTSYKVNDYVNGLRQ